MTRALNSKIFILLTLALGLFYFFVNPLETKWMPQCIFHKITGLQCMGCGSQRMVHALLHGDLKAAFEANALIFCSIPFLIFLIFIEFNRTRYPRIYSHCHSITVIITVSAILLAWLILRNIFGL